MSEKRRQFSAAENHTLIDTESIALRRPFERQIEAVEQGLGVELCGLLPLADRFHDCGGYERQARETLDVALANNFVARDLGERVHTAGGQLVKPHPRALRLVMPSLPCALVRYPRRLSSAVAHRGASF